MIGKAAGRTSHACTMRRSSDPLTIAEPSSNRRVPVTRPCEVRLSRCLAAKPPPATSWSDRRPE